MAEYPSTGTILDSKTHALLSTQIVVKVGAIAVGALQELTARQTRRVNRISEIGTDGVIEAVPHAPTEVEITVRRIAFDRLRITESFARGFLNIAAQRIPFDIEIHENFKEEDGQIFVYRNCWFNSTDTPYKSDDYLIAESATITCEFVHIINPADGGERGLPFQVDPIEASTDLGGRRGSLDAPGLVDALFNTNI